MIRTQATMIRSCVLRLQVEAIVRARSTVGAATVKARAFVVDERGEITSTVAMIGVLVVGALAAGAVIASRIKAHAFAIPGPGGG